MINSQSICKLDKEFPHFTIILTFPQKVSLRQIVAYCNYFSHSERSRGRLCPPPRPAWRRCQDTRKPSAPPSHFNEVSVKSLFEICSRLVNSGFKMAGSSTISSWCSVLIPLFLYGLIYLFHQYQSVQDSSVQNN